MSDETIDLWGVPVDGRDYEAVRNLASVLFQRTRNTADKRIEKVQRRMAVQAAIRALAEFERAAKAAGL